MDRSAGVKETEFKGVSYRSRTEARWAVFFDRLGVDFEYEPTQFKLRDGRLYTPDFYVSDFETYVEVKPDNEEIILEEAGKALSLYEEKHAESVWLAMGPPSPDIPSILDFSIRERFAGYVERYLALEEFVHAAHIRATILEDRRDEFRYWLMGVADWYFGYAIGGPGEETDHEREPLIHKNVEAAYKKAKSAFRKDAPETHWTENPFA